MPKTLVLFENALGLSLFECSKLEELEIRSSENQKILQDYNKFRDLCQLHNFSPFPSSEVALDTMNHITEGKLSDFLRNYINTEILTNLHKQKYILYVSEKFLATEIKNLGVNCETSENVRELHRGIRKNFCEFAELPSFDDLKMAQLGLSHGYSRAKVKFNQHGDDNHIISSSALLTTLEKDSNSFAMKLREWFSVYFPELSKLVIDHYTYARCVLVCLHLDRIDRDSLLNILNDESLTDRVILAANNSIGRELKEEDREIIHSLAERVASLIEHKLEVGNYLRQIMHLMAPNLNELVGERIGSQLIACSGSISNLAKYPSSTIQLLGAEKALFNALKKRKNTPKHGLIFNAGLVRASDSDLKGRSSRSLANKISIASRIDAFSDEFRDGQLGRNMKELLDERLEAAKKGNAVEPNLEAMLKIVQKTRNESSGHFQTNTVQNSPMQSMNVFSQSNIETETPKKQKRRKEKTLYDHNHAQEAQVVEQVNEEENMEMTELTPKRRRRRRSHEEKTGEQTPVINNPSEEQNVEIAENTPRRRKRHRAPDELIDEQHQVTELRLDEQPQEVMDESRTRKRRRRHHTEASPE